MKEIIWKLNFLFFMICAGILGGALCTVVITRTCHP